MYIEIRDLDKKYFQWDKIRLVTPMQQSKVNLKGFSSYTIDNAERSKK